ncbi:MAG: glycosyltransferase family 2 protein [Bacteroidales bacterium]|nr:glycosyltransferase family 2 protein [Bacteroidales bacterium]
MLDLSVIILTYNEEIHIRRCVENIQPIAKEIFIVDSFSTDKTIEIAKSLGAKVFQNKWENNYAKQFNWALDNLPIQTQWVLRLDADEYLTSELIDELTDKLKNLSKDTTGIIFKRRHIFLNKWIKRGTYPVKLLRLFRYRKAICEQRWMDEHIQLIEGSAVEFEYDFVDHNLNNLSWWTNKHNGYAIRETIDLLDIELNIFGKEKRSELTGQAAGKRNKKYSYAKKPLFLRSFAYFIYRYIFRLGFTEGKEGFLWHFLQGWWYRTLVDAKIFEIKKICGNDKAKIIKHLRDVYNIDLSE